MTKLSRVLKFLFLIGIISIVVGGALSVSQQDNSNSDDKVVEKKVDQEEIPEETYNFYDYVDQKLWDGQSDPKIYGEPASFEMPIKITPIPELIELGKQSDHYHNDISLLYGYSENTGEHHDSHTPYPTKEGKILAKYKVEGDALSKIEGNLSVEQEGLLKYNFGLLTRLIPANYRGNLSKIFVFSESDSAAYVMYDEDEKGKQVIGLNLDNSISQASSVQERYSQILVYIHEFAHLFSMNPAETIHGQNYFYPNGATFDGFKSNAYLNTYYKAFWTYVPLYYLDNVSKKMEEVETFHELNEDKFWTSYATYNPYEDFAESFTYFVAYYVPLDEETEPKFEKLRYFYQFREMVELRGVLLKNLVDILSNP